MDSRITTAARVAEIAPFHVMEVQTAARALEAAGRTVVHMEIGEPDFPTPAPVIAAAQRGDRRGRHLLHVGARPARAARGDRAPLRRPLRRRRRARARRSSPRARRRRCCWCWRCSSTATTAILLADPGYPCNRHFVRVLEGEPVGVPVGAGDAATSSRPTLDRAALDAAHARRADRVAVESRPAPSVPHDEMRRIAAAVAAARRPPHRRRDLPRPDLRRRGRAACSSSRDDAFVISSFSKYFNMTGWRLGWVVAPERHVRDLEKLAQNLYISPATPSQRAALACFDAGDARDPRGAPRRVRGAPRLPGAGAARAGLRASRSCRPAASSSTPTARALRDRQRARSAATCSRHAGVAIHAGHRLRRPPRARARALRLHDRRRPSSRTASRGSRATCGRLMMRMRASSRIALRLPCAGRLRRHATRPTTTGRARRGSSTSWRARSRSTR